jgi:MraZ protein
MAGFKGQAEYSVDNKGRVAIPAKMRNAMNPEAKHTFTITRGFDRCVYLYPLDEWARIERQIASLNSYRPDTRGFVRSLLMWAEEVGLDGQGRVSIPKTLMDFAAIEDRVTIVGALDHIEIWNPNALSEYLNTVEDYETLAEKVMVTV